MSKVAANIVFIHVGTNATIPAHWSRDTNFDGKYFLVPSGGEDGGGTGGSLTHTHPDDTSHNHSISCGNSNSPIHGILGTNSYSHVVHSHGTKSSGNRAATFGTASNEGKYHEVIFVKSDGNALISNGLVGISVNAGFVGWKKCDGVDTATNLVDRWLKGAGAGGDAGATADGGIEAHTHTSSHNHPSVNSNTSRTTAQSAGTGGLAAASNHVHVLMTSLADGNVQNADGEAPTYKVVFVRNETGGEDLPTGVCGLWPYSEASIPVNWERVAGLNAFFLKGGADYGDIGDLDGADQHNHSANAHNGHSITAGIASLYADVDNSSAVVQVSDYHHTHAWTLGNATISVPNNTSKNNYPPYIKAMVIRYTSSFIPRLPLMGVG